MIGVIKEKTPLSHILCGEQERYTILHQMHMWMGIWNILNNILQTNLQIFWYQKTRCNTNANLKSKSTKGRAVIIINWLQNYLKNPINEREINKEVILKQQINDVMVMSLALHQRA